MPETLEGVIGRAGENRFAPRRPPIALAVWVAAVGLRVAERARPVDIQNGALIVRVATSVWANELSLLHPTEPFALMLSARELFAVQRRVSLLQRRDNEQVVCRHVRTIQVQHR